MWACYGLPTATVYTAGNTTAVEAAVGDEDEACVIDEDGSTTVRDKLVNGTAREAQLLHVDTRNATYRQYLGMEGLGEVIIPVVVNASGVRETAPRSPYMVYLSIWAASDSADQLHPVSASTPFHCPIHAPLHCRPSPPLQFRFTTERASHATSPAGAHP